MKSFAWILLILPLLAVTPARAQDDPPNLTGSWVLNPQESDDIGAVIREAMGTDQSRGNEGMRGGGKGGGGRGGGGRGGGRQSGSVPDQDRAVKAQQKMARLQEEYSRLEIFQDGIELNVTNGLDISRLLFTDGRQMNVWTQQGEARATATWQDRTLVVQWKTGQETMSRIRHFTLSEGGQHLTMTEARRLPGHDKSVNITMVYDLGR